MGLRLTEDRLFQNNTKEDISRWAKALRFFHYMRSRGGHNCEGDSFCAYFIYKDEHDLKDKLSKIGIELAPLEDGFIAFDPTKSYSFDDLDKLKVTISKYPNLEQPQHIKVYDQKVHVWVMDNVFEVSVSGTRDGKLYKVSEEDFTVCCMLDDKFGKLGWESILDKNIELEEHCISEKIYPELF